jgi:pimeloyl-ACP methyl ester carboxylesterase
LSINHKVIGAGQTVVMLPGWTLDHHVMLACMEPIFRKREGWKRIYLDPPGTGRSEPADYIRDSDGICAAILNFLDGLVPGEPFVVCGYSYGAMIARGIAHERRDLVRGLMLFAPVTVPDGAARTLPAQQVLRRDPALLSQLSPQEALEFGSTAVIQGEQQWARYRDEIDIPRRATNNEYLDRIRQNGYGLSSDLDAESFEHPALIIAGRQDNVVGFQDSWKLMGKFPRATFAVLDCAGHLLQIEQAGVFDALVNEWLDRVEFDLQSGP